MNLPLSLYKGDVTMSTILRQGEPLQIIVTDAGQDVVTLADACRYALKRLEQIRNASPHISYAFRDIERELNAALGITPEPEDDPFAE
jgi:hypothetical protein